MAEILQLDPLGGAHPPSETHTVSAKAPVGRLPYILQSLGIDCQVLEDHVTKREVVLLEEPAQVAVAALLSLIVHGARAK